MSDGTVIISTKLDTKSFDKQIEQVEGRLEEIDTMLSHPKEFELTSNDIKDLNIETEKLNNKLINLRKQKKKIDDETNNKFQKWLQNAGGEIEKNIKKVGRWAIAIFGIRSAYSMVRQSMSTLSQYDDELANKLDGIRLIIASSIEPIVRRVVDLAYMLLSYINAITKSMFNYDIFAKSSEKALKKGAKAANDMKKSLAGFDEINIVSGGTTISGGGGEDLISVLKPTIDEETLKRNEKVVKSFFDTITDYWETEVWNTISESKGTWDLFIDGVLLTTKGFYDIFKGLIDFMVGLFDMLVSIFTGNTKKIEEGWNKSIKGLAEILKGVVEIIAGLFIGLVGTITGIFQTIIDVVVKIYKKMEETVIKINNSIINFVKNLINNVISFATTLGSKIGTALGNALKSAINGALSVIETMLNIPIRGINSLLNTINKIPGVNIPVIGTLKLPRLAKGGILNMPGRGINYGMANIAERGAEGVIPLTDTQQMELLGEAIGKFITINANITNSMNGRVISRELQKIQNENNFAMNR